LRNIKFCFFAIEKALFSLRNSQKQKTAVKLSDIIEACELFFAGFLVNYIPALYYRTCRTNVHAITTMQTMLLLDNMRNTTGFNTVLRTCIQAASATDAIFGDKITLFFFSAAPNENESLSMGLFDKSNHSPLPS